MPNSNHYAVGVSTNADFDIAAEAAVGQIAEQLEGSADLVIVFSSHYPAEKTIRMNEHVQRLSPTHLVGCNCMGVIGRKREMMDGEPGLVIWAAQMPQTEISTFQLQYERSDDGAAFTGWPEETSALENSGLLIALADPFSFPMDLLLARMNEDRPELPIVGGMASGSNQPGQWNLFFGDQIPDSGAAIISFEGEQLPIPMVSQACRPIGNPMIVTGCERNVIQTLGGRPAVEQLFEMFDGLPTREQKQVNNGLSMGIAVTEYKDSFGYGDYLIRNVLGVDKNTGAITVGDYVRVGQTVQFHVRDHETASADLNRVCDCLLDGNELVAKSALIFSCNGRGPRMFPDPDHDCTVLSDRFEIETIAGFFAGGEIGPVGNQNFLHGFTASCLVFR